MSLSESASVPKRRNGLRTSEEIRTWLLSRIAERSSFSPEAVDIHQPFSEFGLDSLETLNLMMELEEWLGRELEATIAWDYPTVEGIARHLGSSKKSV